MIALPLTLSESSGEKSRSAANKSGEKRAKARANNFHKAPEVPVRTALTNKKQARIVSARLTPAAIARSFRALSGPL